MPGNYDPGPPAAWEGLLSAAPLNVYQQNPRFRTEFCPVYYRGRLDGSSRILVIGQDPATDEILAQRILVGDAGQLVQGLLKKLGIRQSYTMLNTFLYGIRGQFDATMRNLSSSGPILAFRNSLLDQIAAANHVEAVLAFGNAAHDSFDRWPSGHNLTVFKLLHPTALQGVPANWNQSLQQMLTAITPDPNMNPDPTPYGAQFGPHDRADIPRFDLNFAIPDWHGTGGTHSSRGGSATKITWTSEIG